VILVKAVAGFRLRVGYVFVGAFSLLCSAFLVRSVVCLSWIVGAGVLFIFVLCWDVSVNLLGFHFCAFVVYQVWCRVDFLSFFFSFLDAFFFL